MPTPEAIKELRPHVIWDAIKELFREGTKLMLPFLAGMGAKQWVTEHVTALMYLAAFIVAFVIAFWDRFKHATVAPSGLDGGEKEAAPSAPSPPSSPFLDEHFRQANQHRIDLLGSQVVDLNNRLQALTQENATLKQDNEDLRNPSDGIKRIIKSVVDEDLMSQALKDAPDLRIDYKTDGVKNHLTLINEGEETIYRWTFRPLRISYSKLVSTDFGNAAIESKHKLPTEVKIGNLDKPLYYFVHKDLPSEATVFFEVYYEDKKGRGFIREFEAKTYMNETLLFQPGPIKPQLPQRT